IERRDFAVATVPNAAGQSIVYTMGGRSAAVPGAGLGKVMAYNVSTNTWSLKASMPVPLHSTNGAGVIDGKIYVSGGCRNSACVVTELPTWALFVYDPATNTWTSKNNMPVGGYAGLTGVINGNLYVLTTCVEEVPNSIYFDQCAPSKFFRYNRVTDRWTVLPRPANSYYTGAGGVIGGKFYAALGNHLEVYDPATNQWTTKASPPSPVGYASAGAVLLGQFYAMGGGGGVNRDAFSTVSAYDPATNTWTSKAPLPTARLGIGASKVFLNGQPRIEVVGGARPGNNLQYIP
ncbi:MAG TPA: hypothetical protein VFX42_06070, partial [Gemmatimonadales bacterium]|nr:hypothetical protein [Gemmatimonadales bacterium]